MSEIQWRTIMCCCHETVECTLYEGKMMLDGLHLTPLYEASVQDLYSFLSTTFDSIPVQSVSTVFYSAVWLGMQRVSSMTPQTTISNEIYNTTFNHLSKAGINIISTVLLQCYECLGQNVFDTHHLHNSDFDENTRLDCMRGCSSIRNIRIGQA